MIPLILWAYKVRVYILHHEWNFFVTLEPAQWTNFLRNILQSKPHTPLASALFQWLILNCDQTLQANFLAFWNNLVSQVRDMIRPWNFESMPLDKRSWLMTSFSFLMTYSKICPWSVSYRPVILHSQWHYWSSSLHKGYLWYKFQPHTISRSWVTLPPRAWLCWFPRKGHNAIHLVFLSI